MSGSEKRLQAGRLTSWKRPQSIVTFLVVLYLVLFFAPQILISIPSGQAGVLFRRFRGGTDVVTVYGEGIHIVCPWDKMFVYDVRIQETATTIEALTRNGLTVHLGVSIRYRPERSTLGVLHQDVGPDYLQKIVIPKVTGVLRTEVGKYTAEELFTSRRPVLVGVFDESLSQVGSKCVLIDDLTVTSIQLPPTIQKAVEEKIEQQHLAEAYEFHLVREQQEAKRKEWEAEGTKMYNQIVASSLTPPILQWKGIEATRELATSPNAKVIIMGNSPGSLPIILGADKYNGSSRSASHSKCQTAR